MPGVSWADPPRSGSHGFPRSTPRSRSGSLESARRWYCDDVTSATVVDFDNLIDFSHTALSEGKVPCMHEVDVGRALAAAADKLANA